jgi:hypothetical protein
MEAPENAWMGPLKSPWGFHIVWIHEHRPARLPAVAEVRSQLRQAWLRERTTTLYAERIAELRRSYIVRLPCSTAGSRSVPEGSCTS